ASLQRVRRPFEALRVLGLGGAAEPGHVSLCLLQKEIDELSQEVRGGGRLKRAQLFDHLEVDGTHGPILRHPSPAVKKGLEALAAGSARDVLRSLPLLLLLSAGCGSSGLPFRADADGGSIDIDGPKIRLSGADLRRIRSGERQIVFRSSKE